MPHSHRDLSKYIIEADASASRFKDYLDQISGGSLGKGAVFNPLDGVVAGIREGNAIYQILKMVCIVAARGIILPVELLLRQRFGERYFSVLPLLAFLTLYALSRFFLDIDPMYANVLLIEVAALTGLNRWICFFRDRRGDYWHSYSEGESMFRIPALDRALAQNNFTINLSTQIIEPALVGLAGFACKSLLPPSYINLGFERLHINPLALYLLVAGAVLFIYQQYCYLYRRNLFLDEKDRIVIAEIRADIAEEPESAGVYTHKGVSYSILGGKRNEREGNDEEWA